MARKSAVLIPVIIAAVAVGIIGLTFTPKDIKERSPELSRGTVRINNDVITVEIAQTAAEQQRWLTFRQDKLPSDTALLLKYDKLDLHEVWMLNIEYNLDLVWFDAEGNAVYMKKNAPPCPTMLDPNSCTYKPTKPALYVIAGTAGFVEAHNIQLGSKMTLISV